MADQPHESPDTGAFGLAADDWDRDLQAALDGRDHGTLHRLLGELHREMDQEADAVLRHAEGPHLDRLVEQARRLVTAAPTQQEALEDELTRERRLWAGFRQRYRDTFLPTELHPFVESSGLFLEPAAGGVQFEGFEKYAAHGDGATREAVTLFRRSDDSAARGTPANFFSAFEAATGRFTVARAYRTILPRGAGQACIAEHLAWLVPDPGALRQLMFDNVQHSATYAALVDVSGVEACLRPDVDAQECPLGRLGGRLVAGMGLRVAGLRPALDGFGFLDLVLELEPS